MLFFWLRSRVCTVTYGEVSGANSHLARISPFPMPRTRRVSRHLCGRKFLVLFLEPLFITYSCAGRSPALEIPCQRKGSELVGLKTIVKHRISNAVGRCSTPVFDLPSTIGTVSKLSLQLPIRAIVTIVHERSPLFPSNIPVSTRSVYLIET